MMRALIFATALLSLGSGTAARAAQDVGLGAQNHRTANIRSGVGAQLGLSVKFDSKRAVRESERVHIGFAIGPVMAVSDAETENIRRRTGNMAGFSLRPGHSATLTFAGQPIATHYTILGAAEAAKAEAGKPETKTGKGPSTAGYIAIGVGALIGIGLVTAVLATDSITDGISGRSN